MNLETFEDFIGQIEDPEQQARTAEVLAWVEGTFPNLGKRIAWNQPMFTDHDTFIAGFSVSKKHLAMSPELVGIEAFSAEIKKAGYNHTKMLIQFPWDKPIDYDLLRRIIQFNIEDKAECTTFWRK